MSWRALLYRRPQRAAGDRDHVRSRGLSRAAAPAPAGAPLHAAHRRRRRARSCSPCRRAAASRKRATSRRSTAAGSRRGSSGCRRRRRSCTAPRCRCAACRIASCIGAACAARCGPRPTRAARRLLCVAGEAPHVDRRIGDFLKREARRDLDAASRRHAAALGVAIKRISVRDQSSRWGSCSNTGVLSFSWRLILAPPFVLDYLAAHEVAHLVELNHSPRFWRLVRRLYPDADRAKVAPRAARRRPASLPRPRGRRGRGFKVSATGGPPGRKPRNTHHDQHTNKTRPFHLS